MIGDTQTYIDLLYQTATLCTTTESVFAKLWITANIYFYDANKFSRIWGTVYFVGVHMNCIFINKVCPAVASSLPSINGTIENIVLSNLTRITQK